MKKIYRTKIGKIILRRLYFLFNYKSVSGFDNVVSLSDTTSLWRCRIDVEGNGNIIDVSNNVLLQNVRIFIRGDNCRLYIGKNVRMKKGELWLEDSDSGITIGAKTTIESAHIAAIEGTKVTIGDDCMLSTDIEIRTGDSHSIINSRTGTRINPSEDVYLGNHVWVGSGCTVLKGVFLGHNSIIGARSLVSRGTYPENIILAGIPAQIIRKNVSWSRKRI